MWKQAKWLCHWSNQSSCVQKQTIKYGIMQYQSSNTLCLETKFQLSTYSISLNINWQK